MTMMMYIKPVILRLQLRLENAKEDVEEGAEMPPEKAFCWYKKLADEGNPYAELALAKCYENGYGIRKKRKFAIEHYKTSKYKIYAFREKVLFYENSKRQEQMEEALLKIDDNTEAFDNKEKGNFEIYNVSAEKENADTLFDTACHYLNGDIVKKDVNKALYLLHKAAVKGCLTAQEKLGRFYYEGKYVEKDLGKAAMWYRINARETFRKIETMEI